MCYIWTTQVVSPIELGSFVYPTHVVVNEKFEVTLTILGGSDLEAVVGLYSGDEMFYVSGEYLN